MVAVVALAGSLFTARGQETGLLAGSWSIV